MEIIKDIDHMHAPKKRSSITNSSSVSSVTLIEPTNNNCLYTTQASNGQVFC